MTATPGLGFDDGTDAADAADHNQDVLAATYSPGGARIATASADGNVMVWDAQTGQAQWNLQDTTPSSARSLSPDSSLLASSGDDHMARIWEVKTGKLLLTLEDKAGGVRSVSLRPTEPASFWLVAMVRRESSSPASMACSVLAAGCCAAPICIPK